MEVVGAGGPGPLRFSARGSSLRLPAASSGDPPCSLPFAPPHLRRRWQPLFSLGPWLLYPQNSRAAEGGVLERDGDRGLERVPRPQRLLPGCFLRPGPGLLGTGGRVCVHTWGGVGAVPPSWRGIPRRWRRKLNLQRGNISGEEERPALGEVGAGWQTPGRPSAVCLARSHRCLRGGGGGTGRRGLERSQPGPRGPWTAPAD